MNSVFVLLAVWLSHAIASAQQPETSIRRINPTSWWVGMKNPNLQLLVFGPNAGTLSYSVNYPGIRLLKTHSVENKDYVFLDLNISPATKPGVLQVIGKNGNQTISRSFELKARKRDYKRTGVSSADLIYLIMPDRFANGDPANDRFADMADPNSDTRSPYLRHGGDLQGITAHLDYLQDLGVTAIWLTPVIENDEQLKKEGPNRMQAGYHGYHFTDHYLVDRRLGGNEGYDRFAKSVHDRGMKLIQDAVYNHISDDHWMYKNLPSKDWLNNWPAYTGSSHREQPLFDPYSAAIDRQMLLNGWFTSFLPDLNQRNPFLANFLIQHAIWSTEMFNLDAWRIDTYKYNDQAFMNRCNQALLTEFPGIHLIGESTASGPLTLSYFVNSNVDYPFKSNLPGTFDFPLNYAINDALRSTSGNGDGLNRLYETIAHDIVYADPMKLVTQLDNHDMDRYLSVIGEDNNKYKIGVTWLLTLRGIPSWYYGTEILMKNFKNPTDAEVRKDFPGGFPSDRENKFTAEGRTQKENEAFSFVRKLAGYRKMTPALHSGKLMHYYPQDGKYVYFRYDAGKCIMIATNATNGDAEINTTRFTERMKGYTSARNVITNETIGDLSTIKLPAMTALVLELIK